MVEAATSAGDRRADVTLLYALRVATVSPAHDEKRGVGHHLICGPLTGQGISRAHHASWRLHQRNSYRCTGTAR